MCSLERLRELSGTIRSGTTLLGLYQGLATAIFSQKLIDDILPSNDQLRLFAGVGLLLGLLLARSFLSFLRQLFLLRQRRDFNVRIIGFSRYFEQLPQSYTTIVGEEGINLSGGQRQLVAPARALYHRSQLLLLDEPTAALDRDTEHFVLDLLGRLREEMGIVLCTHRLKTARRADRIYIIEHGRIQRQGRHSELLQSDNLYSRAWQNLAGPEGRLTG